MAHPEVTGRKPGARTVDETTPQQARAPPIGRKLLSPADLRELGIPYSRVHLDRLERDGLFPQRVRIGGGNFIAWLEDEVAAYVDALAAARPKRAAPKTLETRESA
jgi:predicted DNA-binding transcriptional regulator AlpA